MLNLVLQAPIGICVLDAATLVSEITNEKFVEIAGKPYKSIIGKHYWDTFAEAAPYYEAALQNVIDNGVAFYANEVELMLIRHGREEIIYVTFVYEPVKDSNGTVKKVVVWVLENTLQVQARRKVEESIIDQVKNTKRIEESESRFRFAMKAGNLGWWDLDLATFTLNASELCKVNFGRPLDRPFTYDELRSSIHPDDRERMSQAVEVSISTGKDYDIEYRILWPDGSLRWINVRAKAQYDNENRPVSMIGVSIDISERKISEEALREREERFRNLSDQAPMFIFMADENVKISYVNKALLRYVNLNHSSDFSDQVWAQHVHPDDVGRMNEIFAQAWQTHSTYQVEIRLREATTRQYNWFVFTGVPRYEGEIFKGFLITGVNIQAQKELTKNLEQKVLERTDALDTANKELHRSNEDLRQFAHVASHDLKEPVRKIKTFGHRLFDEMEDRLDERGKMYLTKILNASDRMTSMIDGVLTYSTLNAALLEPKNVDLSHIVENIKGDLEIVVSQTRTEIVYQDLPVVQGAQVLLYQLFYNLINNSIKFRKPDVNPVIDIKGTVENKGEWHTIIIRDNGIGFDPRFADSIFDTFIRLNPKDQYEGTGLGLALCKKIVERHGGTITAQSVISDGATFTIKLPARQNKNYI